MKSFALIVLPFLICIQAHSQFPTKKLSRSVTNSVENEIAPFLSMDGNTLIYSRKRAMDEIWKVQISKKVNGAWQRPDELKILNTLPKLRLLGSYGLNTDATEIIFSSKRRGGIGNYDLWITKKQGNSWSAPKNLAKPVNSPDEEINPFFSLNGNEIYFITRKAGDTNGKLMKTKRRGSNYSKPQLMDLGGEFFCVRIAADQKTMYLSKVTNDKTELYISRLVNNKWSKAEKIIDYTSSNDKYFGLNSSNTNLLISAKKDETYDLFYCKLSDEYNSVPVTKLSVDLAVPYIAEINGSLDNLVAKTRKVDQLYLPNDQSYEVKLKTQDYFTEFVSLSLDGEKSGTKTISPSLTSKKETFEIVNLSNIRSTIDKDELYKKLQIVKETFNGDYSGFELVVHQNNVSTDSVKSDVFFKDISYEKEVELIKETQEVKFDTLGVNEDNLPIIKADTVTIEERQMVLKFFPLYTNDKTEMWSAEIVNALKMNGVNITPVIIKEKNIGSLKYSGVFLRPIK